MANKYNTPESVTSVIDDEPTAELEALSETLVYGTGPAAAQETDEHTCSFDDSENIDDIPASQLRSDLRIRDESIHKLQYDIEQLRARWTGLEKEIKAREEISENLNDQLRDQREQLADHQHQRVEQEKAKAALREQLAAKDAELADVNAELNSMQDNASTGAARIAILEMQHSSDASAMQMLEEDLQRLRTQIDKDAAEQRVPLADLQLLQRKLQESQTTLADLTQYVEGRKQAWHEQQTELSNKGRVIAEQAQQIEALSAKLVTAEATQQSAAERQDDEASYDLAINVQDARRRAELAELQSQIQRTESYADSLRHQLQDTRQDAERRNSDQFQAQQALDNALEQIRSLRTQLEDERLTNAELQLGNSESQRHYDDEIQQLKDESSVARTTVAEQRERTERLEAELADRHEAFISLQDRFDEVQQQSGDMQDRLQKQLTAQRQQLEELHDKLETKDKAISALLNELTAKNASAESIEDIEQAVQDRRDRTISGTEDRDRGSTRLLIGMIDGQKLRFPLFKERLSIGRAANNDIQLKTQCISRRHAVIVSDSQGCRIVDQGSKNGVFVNGTRVKDAPVVSGDKLVIGTAVLIFEERNKR